MGAAVKIVRIELDGVASAGFVLQGLVPATSDAQSVLLGIMCFRRAPPGEVGKDGGGPVRGVVVHDEDVEGKFVSWDNALFTASAIVCWRFARE